VSGSEDVDCKAMRKLYYETFYPGDEMTITGNGPIVVNNKKEQKKRLVARNIQFQHMDLFPRIGKLRYSLRNAQGIGSNANGQNSLHEK
jgi:hypothetical protein